MGVMPNTEEYEKMMRLRRRKGRELLADPTAVGGPPPGRGPTNPSRSLISANTGGAGGGNMPFGVEANYQTPAAAPQAQPSPVGAAPSVPPARPVQRTRTVQGSVQGPPDAEGNRSSLSPDQIGGEIQRAAQDRSIMAQRLTAVFRAAQSARSAGNLDEYNRLMDQWQGGVGERRQNEAYGRDLSAARPRQFVTPEHAESQRPMLQRQLLEAKNADISRRHDELTATPSYEAAGSTMLPANIRNAKFSAPQDQIRQNGLADFMAQEPVADADGNMTTPNIMEDRRRAIAAERLRREAVNAPKEASAAFGSPVDAASADRRFSEASDQAGTAAGRAGVEYGRRQNAIKFQRDFQAGEQAVATADQERRRTGNDAASIEAKAKYELAKRQYGLAASETPDKRAEVLLSGFSANVLRGAEGDANAQQLASQSIDQLESQWDSLSETQQLAIQNSLIATMDTLAKSKPNMFERNNPANRVWEFLNNRVDPYKRSKNIDDAIARLRSIFGRQPEGPTAQ